MVSMADCCACYFCAVLGGRHEAQEENLGIIGDWVFGCLGDMELYVPSAER